MKDLTPKLARIKDNFIVFIQLRKINNFVQSPELEKEFGITGTEVRELINHLSNLKYPIGNTIRIDEDKTIKAYFWAENYEELFPTIQELRSRSNEIYERVRNLEKIYSDDEEPKFL